MMIIIIYPNLGRQREEEFNTSGRLLFGVIENKLWAVRFAVVSLYLSETQLFLYVT